MASSEHIAQAKAVEAAIVSLDGKLTGLANNYSKLIETIKAGNQVISENAKTYENLKTAKKNTADQSKKLDTQQRELIKLDKQMEVAEVKLTAAYQQVQKATIKKQEAAKKYAAEQRKSIKEDQKAEQVSKLLKGSYDAISVSLSKNIAKFKGMSKEQRENSKAGKALTATIQRQDKELKKLDSQMGRSQRSVGNYRGAIMQSSKSLLGAFGLIGGVAAFARVLTSSVSKIATFEKAQSEVAAVLRTNKEGIEDLTAASLQYGKITKFTAIEVSGLQKELAKLGFTQDEILASIGAILNLAAATESELPLAAKVAGTALRAFDLDMAESGRVASVLAVATTKSALTFQDYEDALANVAPVAAAYNFSIEETVALLGTLKDAGFQANKASVATRNILLRLADSGGELAKALGGGIRSFDELIPALIRLREQGISLNETLELTDKRSVAAFNRFLQAAESADELKTGITDVTDELDRMVEVRLDNLAGDVTKLASAWDGLVQSTRGGVGVLRSGVRFLKNLVIAVDTADLAFKRVSKFTEEDTKRTFDALLALSKKQPKAFQEIIKEQNKISFNQINLLSESKKKFIEELEAILFTRAESLLLWDEYLRRRTEQNEQEIAAREAAEAKKLEAEEKAEIERKKAAEKAAAEAAKIAAKNAKAAEKRQKKEIDALLKSLAEQEKAIKDAGTKKKTWIDEAEAELDADAMKALDEDIALEKARADAILRVRQRQFEQEKLLIESTAKNEAEARQGVSDLAKRFIQEDIDALQSELERSDLTAKQKIEIEQDLADAQLELNKVLDEDDKAKQKERIERAKEVADMIGEIGGKLFEFQLGNIENERIAMQQRQEERVAEAQAELDQGIISEEEFARQKEFIDKQAAKKEAQLNLKKAKAEKAQNLFSAIINTAKAVVSVLPNIPLSIVMAALGAVQIATIASKPLPKVPAFHGGKKGTPGTGFIAGDSATGGASRELMKLRNGQSFMVDKPTYFEGDKFKGATVYTNKETEEIIRQADKQNTFVFDTKQIVEQNKKSTRQIVRAIGRNNYMQQKAISRAFVDKALN